jgi:hypothetical protein
MRSRATVGLNSTFWSILMPTLPRILLPMFQVLRTITFLGLLAAGMPVFVSAQAAGSDALPPVQQGGKPASGSETGAPHLPLFDAQHRPITAGGFVKTGPVSLKTSAKRRD